MVCGVGIWTGSAVARVRCGVTSGRARKRQVGEDLPWEGEEAGWKPALLFIYGVAGADLARNSRESNTFTSEYATPRPCTLQRT